jgi:hypothetical protein
MENKNKYLTFEEALKVLKEGGKIANVDWLNPYKYIQIVNNETPKDDILYQPYIASFFKNGGTLLVHPYSFDMLDVFSDSWLEVTD